MSTLLEVRAAIITTLTATLTTTKGYKRVPANPILPCVIVQPTAADYMLTFSRGADMWDFNLHVLVPSADDDVAQDHLDAYVAGTGTNSIARIIHAADTLGLSDVKGAHVAKMTAYGFTFDAVSITHLGATLLLRLPLTNS